MEIWNFLMDNPKLRDVESRKKGKMRKEWGKE